MAGFEVIIYGRFWVNTEGVTMHLAGPYGWMWLHAEH
jgi:hypothetical protein